jgi:hypothetical protein
LWATAVDTRKLGFSYGGTTTAVAVGVVNAIKHTHIEAGDVYMKRVVLKSKATTLDELLGDLKVAEDYKCYLQHKPIIDTLISFDPTSVFAATWVITILRAEGWLFASIGCRLFGPSSRYRRDARSVRRSMSGAPLSRVSCLEAR